jgi:uroporphyrinogen III methyltransferase/synthase
MDELIAGLGSMDVVVFTSRNGVEICFERLRAMGLDARALAGVDVAVVGTASADACRERGIEPDVIPPRGARTSIGLLEELTREDVAGTRIAIVRAEQGDDRLHEGLAERGATVSLVLAYRTVVEPASEEQAAALAAADVATFTSESTVRNALELLPAGAQMPPAVTIGPTTTAAARDAGIVVLQEAEDPSIESLVDALLERAADNAGCSPWRHAAPDTAPVA